MSRSLAFRHLLTPQGLQAGRRLHIDEAGLITAIEPSSGPFDGWLALPGMPNAHSHAFQRALAGRAEARGAGEDFWSWRSAMYRLAERLDAEGLAVIATQVYGEMLAAGYTSVAEFHYLHRGSDGSGALEMAAALTEAADSVGIRLTLVPVFYQAGGFGGGLEPAQQRFAHRSLERFLALLETLPPRPLGMAAHSLRAVPVGVLARLVEGARAVLGGDAPIHMHVAEQLREVEECRAVFGQSPVALLDRQVGLDRHWFLVHATHAGPADLELLRESGATVVLCPCTEANLGDGLFAATEFAAAGGRLAIGSDSQVRLDPVEELRWMEYGQRLRLQRRACLAERSLGERLWQGCAEAGARALAQPVGVLEPGRYADLAVLDQAQAPLTGLEPEAALDALVTGGSARNIREVYVGGRRLVEGGRLRAGVDQSPRFARTLARLFGS